MKNNKGFSFVELIIVIAIMGILVGIMAPQLVRYLERTNVSADIQLCDSVHTALEIALNDPDVIMATDNSFNWRNDLTTPGNDFRLDSRSGMVNCVFCERVKDQLGFDPFANAAGNYKYMKSSPAKTEGILCVCVNSAGNGFAVYIAHSDITGKGNDINPIGTSYDNLEATNVILVK